MILANTSAWIEYDRATGSRADRRLLQLISDDAPVGVTEPVVMEVLASARSDRQEQQLRRLLSRFDLVRVEPTTDFEAAARIHRQCRRAGITPRGPVDCLIAAVAWRSGASILTLDRDLVGVADVIGVEVDSAPVDPR